MSVSEKFREIDAKTLKAALAHGSFENGRHQFNHNRLRLIGATALNLIIVSNLARAYTVAKNKDLVYWRDQLMTPEFLARLAGVWLIEKDLLLGLSVERTMRADDKARTRIFAEAFEALAGAVFSTYGLSGLESLTPELEKILGELSIKIKEPKLELERLTKAWFTQPPEYRVIKKAGYEHSKYFTVGVFVVENQIGVGKGRSIKEAEIEAAKNALGNAGGWRPS